MGRTCPQCGVLKPLSEYGVNRRRPDGLDFYCRVCVKKRSLEYRARNREKVRESARRRYAADKEKVNAKDRERHAKNPEIGRAKVKAWRKKNRDKFREYQRKYRNLKYKNDWQFRMSMILRCRLNSALSGGNRGLASVISLLGCSLSVFKERIETLFTEEMSWDNWGEVWHLDHIIPLAYFDLQSPADRAIACHYTNYQPLRVEDNLKKGARMPEYVEIKNGTVCHVSIHLDRHDGDA